MVNIQIRGNLLRLDLKILPEAKNFSSIIDSNSHLDMKNYLKKTMPEQKVIYQNTFPIIDSDCEIHVTSFENDNYYDDGHTFFRSKVDDLNCKNKDFKIPIEISKNDYFLLNIKYGYGAGFETEIMDLNYENFDTENLEFYETNFFDNENSIVHSLKLNYLDLEDLGRNKFDFARRQSFVIRKKNGDTDYLSAMKLQDQVEFIKTLDWE